MLTVTNTVVENDEDECSTVTRYTVEGHAELDGSSIWRYDYAQHGMQVAVKEITVIDEDGYKMIYVAHDKGWQIYTDTGFEASISEVLGYDVTFTEQGMQDDNYASLEEA